jgi:hypothetical protein
MVSERRDIMPKIPESKSIEQLMAEADELVRQINADILKDMEEAHRLQFEKHAQKLEEMKAAIQGGIDKKKASELGSGSEGMHEALQDIAKAFEELKKYLS